jgi:hypothetical protein
MFQHGHQWSSLLEFGNKNYPNDIILDQKRYFNSVIKGYLDFVGCKSVLRKHTIPLPSDFFPTSEDCSETEEKAAELVEDYKLDYASCIGSLIYLSHTRTDILFAVNKIGKVHEET